MHDLNGKKVLIIQTAFIGDVILATSLIEQLSAKFPDVEVHFLLRKGNEGLLEGNHKISRLYIWNKRISKYNELWRLISQIRKEKYYLVVNVQRFLTTGLITILSGGKTKVGFRKNPLSFLFDRRCDHEIGNGTHEIERNNKLIEDFTGSNPARPKLYTEEVQPRIAPYQEEPYICMAPSSVWFTKKFPENKWIELINLLEKSTKIYLLGGPDDAAMCERIISETGRQNIQNLAGKLGFLESAALMHGAIMNYVNDSAPLHMASAVNAPVTAIFCSTIPEFGFGPVSDQSKIGQIESRLDCRPCSIHGKKKCPQGHFKCAMDIDVKNLVVD